MIAGIAKIASLTMKQINDQKGISKSVIVTFCVSVGSLIVASLNFLKRFPMLPIAFYQ